MRKFQVGDIVQYKKEVIASGMYTAEKWVEEGKRYNPDRVKIPPPYYYEIYEIYSDRNIMARIIDARGNAIPDVSWSLEDKEIEFVPQSTEPINYIVLEE